MEIAGGRANEELDGEEIPVGSGQGLVRVSTDQLGGINKVFKGLGERLR